MTETTIKSPFPWFGGKSKVAADVWRRFGDVPNYLEPFAGSLAVLLRRPHWRWPDGFNGRIHMETVNDRDGAITNAWRAIQHDPEQTAHWADNPVHEIDLHARHQWLYRRLLSVEGLSEAVQAKARERGILPFAAWQEEDPAAYDCQVAGWWLWGISSWIGHNWAQPNVQASRPHLGWAMGVNRQLPHLGGAKGVNRKLPHLGDTGKGTCAHHRAALIEWFSMLADRLRNVDVVCGDWQRVCGFSPTEKRAAPCGLFLDPPYSQDHGLDTVYGEYHDSTVAARVRRWCLERGDSPDLRIALCGYDTEHGELVDHGWSSFAWTASGGYANTGKNRGRENRKREVIWFSPHCLEPVRDVARLLPGFAD